MEIERFKRIIQYSEKTKRGAYMRYNDLQDKCKECEHMKPWSLDMGGNHGCMCKKHQLDYFNRRSEHCDEYKHFDGVRRCGE